MEINDRDPEQVVADNLPQLKRLEATAHRMTMMMGDQHGVGEYLEDLLQMDHEVFLMWIRTRVDSLLETVSGGNSILGPDHPDMLMLVLCTGMTAQFCAGIEFARAQNFEPLEKAFHEDAYDPDAE